MRKVLLMLLLVLLTVSFAFAGTDNDEPEAAPAAEEEMAPEVKNPDTFVYGTIGEPDTFDPAVAYDNASGNLIQNMYEMLVNWDRGTDQLMPVLCTEVPTAANGRVSADGLTYRFTIRDGVTFHNGNALTAEDVEYSFERTLVVDVDHGPQWMHWMVFFDDFGGRDGDGNYKYTVEEIQSIVEVDGNDVIFTLANPSPFFLAILSGNWSAILDKEWTIAEGGWDGTAADRDRVNNPPTGEELLADIAMGTGPYMLDRWIKGEEVVIERYDGYWGEAPSIARAIYKKVDEWSTRKLMFLQGDLDYAYIEPVYWEEFEQEEGIIYYPDLPSLSVTGLMFQFDINNTDNPYTFSGQLDGQGVPADFFADLDVRQGFMYAWDEEVFLNDIAAGAYMDPVGPIPYGLPFKDGGIERLPHDPAMAEEHFRAAFGGQVWENGFKLELLYNEGNEVRGGAVRMLAENVSELNPKFDISVRSIPWPEFLALSKDRRAPIFSIGWAPDYPDPDNYIDPFMYSQGYFAERGSYSNPVVDELMLEARYATDDATRAANYRRLEEIYVEDAVGLVYGQGIGRQWMRDWITFDGGFYYQPVAGDLFYRLADLNKGY